MKGIMLEIEDRPREQIIRVYDGKKNNWTLIKRISIASDKSGEIDVFVYNVVQKEAKEDETK